MLHFFRTGTWRRLVAHALRSREMAATPMHILRGTMGCAQRSPAISLSLAASEPSADEITITAGTQQAFDILARALLAPGEKIAIEDPGYEPPRGLFQALGLRVIGIPVDRNGLVVDALPHDVRAVYVTPSHQYPLGVAMTPPRRQALLAWADRNNAAIIEDDYDSEFKFARASAGFIAGAGYQGSGYLCRLILKDIVASLAAGFSDCPSIPAIGAAQSEIRQRLAHARHWRRPPSRILLKTANLRATSARQTKFTVSDTRCWRMRLPAISTITLNSFHRARASTLPR